MPMGKILRWRGKICLFADGDNPISNPLDTSPAGSPHGEAVGRQGETYSSGVKTNKPIFEKILVKRHFLVVIQ